MPKLFLLLLNSLLLLIITASALADVKPRSRNVELLEFTDLTLPIMPDLGVQLIFPFDLASLPDDKKIKVKLVNNNAFSLVGYDSGKKNSLATEPGAHTLVIVANKPSSKDGNSQSISDYFKHTHIGMLTITVNDYHLSVMLRTTTNAKRYYSDIILKENEEKKLYLFKNALADVRKQQDNQFKTKMASLDEEAVSKSLLQLGKVALQKPEEYNLRFEKKVELNKGGNVTFYLEKLLDFESFIVLKWHLENTSSKDIMIRDIQLSMTSPNMQTSSVPVVFDCVDNIKAGKNQLCSLTSQDRDLLKMDTDDDADFTLSVMTNRGVLPVTLDK